jgi:hypothetical protein
MHIYKRFFNGQRKRAQYVGKYTDHNGVEWDVWEPADDYFKFWIRLENPTKRTLIQYDPGRDPRRYRCKKH